MLKTIISGLVVAALLFCGTAQASTVVFQEDFNYGLTGTAGMNYTGYSSQTPGLSSLGNNTDVVGAGTGWPITTLHAPNDGNQFVDMIGSGNGATGILSYSTTLGPGAYVLSFLYAGSQRGNITELEVDVTSSSSLDPGDAELNLDDIPSAQLWLTGVLPFSLGDNETIWIDFQGTGDAQNGYGAFIDDITLTNVTPTSGTTPTPEPGSLALFGLVGLAFAAARRRRS